MPLFGGKDKAISYITHVNEIIGTAVDETDFDEYEITIMPEYGEDSVFRKLTKHRVGQPGAGGLLAAWNTRDVKDGIYTIDLTARDKIEGSDDTLHTSTTIVTVAVDNTRPAAEILSVRDKSPDDDELSGMDR